jgi:hypothetical protein
MKKKYFLLFALISGLSFAQVTFNPGIRLGANISHLTNGDNSYWYNDEQSYYQFGPEKLTLNQKLIFISAFRQYTFAKFYALQPEVYYSRQGAN